MANFKYKCNVNLKEGVRYWLTDMAVISDSKLLLCNHMESHPKVYIIYMDNTTDEDEIEFINAPYGIAVVPDTERAVVTLPYEKSIQFINTTNNTKDNMIKIGGWCDGVTAVKDNIYIGLKKKVLILNKDGVHVREIITDHGYNYNLFYNEQNDRLLLRKCGVLLYIKSDGHVIYRYNISGILGLAVDQQGHVYVSGYHSDDIHRLSPDGTLRDIVLNKYAGIQGPQGLTFNSDFTKLFIINRGQSVSVYSNR